MEQNLIFNKTLKQQFGDLFEQLNFQYGCTYMAYIFEDELLSKRVSFATDPAWQEYYLSNQMIESCHIYKEGLRRFTNLDSLKMIVPWNLLKPQNRAERSVEYCREDAGIYHGISFCAKFDGIQEMLGLATEKTHKNFPELLLENIKDIQKQIFLMRYIARKHINEQLWNEQKNKL